MFDKEGWKHARKHNCASSIKIHAGAWGAPAQRDQIQLPGLQRKVSPHWPIQPKGGEGESNAFSEIPHENPSSMERQPDVSVALAEWARS